MYFSVLMHIKTEKYITSLPAGTQHQNDVVSTSMRLDHVASTLIRRHFVPTGLSLNGVKRVTSSAKQIFRMIGLCQPSLEDTSSHRDKGRNPYPIMPDIEVIWKELHTILKGLKPFKATGRD